MKKSCWALVMALAAGLLFFGPFGCAEVADLSTTTTTGGGTTTTTVPGTTTTTTTTIPTTTTTLPDFSWTRATAGAFSSGPKQKPSAAAFQGKLWVLAGATNTGKTNEVWSSLDGTNWTLEALAAFLPRTGQSCLVYENKLWLIGGNLPGGVLTNEVWSSANGRDWTLAAAAAAFPARHDHASVVYDGKMWVIGGEVGGNSNDVWSSDSSGAVWTRATAAAAFSPRKGHNSAVLNGRMWIFCGEDINYYQDDAWSSDDGVTWQLAGTVKSAGVPPSSEAARLFGNAVTYEVNGVTRVFLMAGRNDGPVPFLRDLRHSANGVNWTLVSTSCAYPARQQAAGAVFNNKIWLIGGQDGIGAFLNDVWYAPAP